MGAYELVLEDVREERGPNYFSTISDVRLFKAGREVALLHPEKRVYPVAAMPTTEAAINSRILRDVYVVIGDAQDDGGFTMRTYIKPLTGWIWMGAALMALGGLFSLSDRRYRVAAAGSRVAPKSGVAAE